MATFQTFKESFPSDPNRKGRLFETFLCDTFFSREPMFKAKFKRVWHFSEWPGRWSGRDIGTDLIAEDTEGKICAIQAKFYEEDSQVTKAHIDSFLSDSSRETIDYRLLIATTDRIGKNALSAIDGQEKPVFLYTLRNFNSSPIDWPKSIFDHSAVQLPEKKILRDHQAQAVEAITNTGAERGQLIMACGTGKTLTTLRAAEQIGAESVLVLLPSLLLLSKTVADWAQDSVEDFTFLAVCSDASVTSKAEDGADPSATHLGFPVTTDTKEIISFLNGKGRKVIFSTYHSSPKIAEAFTTSRIHPFDLIIADEAHRCAGKVSSEFATVLDDRAIPAKRRLFTTATPRIFSARTQAAAKAEANTIASMDNESLFGRVLHHLSFSEAIGRETPLLSDYRVVVMGVSQKDVATMIQERRLLDPGFGEILDARTLAAQIGFAKAIKKYNLRRVISFHNRVANARNFSLSFKKLLDSEKTEGFDIGEFDYSFVSGNMPASQRERELKKLSQTEEGARVLVANARCLSEGIDVPSLDAVAFIEPRRSEVDIVQAVGRAIRKSPDKSVGTIVIPIFIQHDASPDEVLQDSSFKHVWGVVNALRAHDVSLGDTLDSLRTALGRRQSVDFSQTKIVLDLPLSVPKNFAEALETRLIETCSDSWDEWYGLLITFSESNGHARVPTKYVTESGAALGSWCDTQRTAFSKGWLRKDRREKLDLLMKKGWVWSLTEAQRQAAVSAIEDFYHEFGHSFVPDRHQDARGRKVGAIAKSLRQAYRNETLEPNYATYLESSLEFSWDPDAFRWNKTYAALRRWARTNRKSTPPKKTIVSIRLSKKVSEKMDINLFRNRLVTSHNYWKQWNDERRSNRSVAPRKLTPRQVAAIERIPFWVWDAKEAAWERNFEALLQFVKREGHCLVPANKHKERLPDGTEVDLSGWLRKQRVSFQKGTLSDQRKRKLDFLGIDWSGESAPRKKVYKLSEEEFSIRLQVLKDFVQLNGHALVPQKEVFNGYPLGSWVSRWRQAYRKTASGRAISAAQIKALEESHPTWTWNAGESSKS